MPGKLVGAASGIALAVTLLVSLSLDRVMAMPDVRDQAKASLDLASSEANASRVAFLRLPWYDVPPLAPEFTAPSPGSRKRAALELPRYQCKIPEGSSELDPTVLDPPEPTYVIVSDIASEDWERLQIPEWLSIKRKLDTDYVRGDFQNDPSIFGISFGKPDFVPNDLLYIYPRISIYTRK